ncbi:hypothetical protein EGI11_02075 [Chryseobacterium sp. H3056]|uniref:Uncharacterized protein n=1 Tax=Kaistella daneshvariae TaxID=2487074 RepID=A0A3N0WZZ1_9FLAO|nr:hypothetical protein EGI11_02075 [Kaistella daneshvariae]
MALFTAISGNLNQKKVPEKPVIFCIVNVHLYCQLFTSYFHPSPITHHPSPINYQPSTIQFQLSTEKLTNENWLLQTKKNPAINTGFFLFIKSD